MSKKQLSLIVALLSIVALGFLFFWRMRIETPESILKIGVALPLSGSMAKYGENGREGLLLAEEHLKGSLPIQIQLIFQNTESTPTGTVAAVRRLIDVERVRFIIGGLTSSGVLAAAPYAQENGVLFFSPAASAPGIPEIGDLVFRNWPSDTALATLYGQAARKKLGLTKLRIIHVSNDYGKTNAESFGASFEEAGGKIESVRSIAEGASDVKTVVTQLRSQDETDGLLMAVYPDEYKILLRELETQGSEGFTRLATDTFYSPELIAELGLLAEGTICAVAAKPGEGYSKRREFIESYRKHFRTSEGEAKEPGLVSDTAYDALLLIAEGVIDTDGSPAGVSKWLLALRGWPGVVGPVTFTATGDISGDIELYRVENSEFHKIAD